MKHMITGTGSKQYCLYLRDCQHRAFMNTDRYKITFQNWDKVADLYQEKFMDMSLYDDTYDTFCQLLQKPDAAIFEIGCGPGNITRYMLSKRPDFKIEAVDVSPNMIRLARNNNPTASFRVMDCREIDTLSSRFDAIICGFCMPYLSKEDCAKLIKDCTVLLKNDGIIYFSVIEGDYAQSGYETSSNGEYKTYVYYHQEDAIREWLNVNQLKLIDLKRKDYVKSDGTGSTHLIFIAKK